MDSPASSSSASSVLNLPLTDHRPNEHLAVLLPKTLWKPDSAAIHCDNFFCRIPFSIFERKHHCRKCGGVFCGACTSRATPLLDASNLDFITPPRNVPITEFESPTSPIIHSRVCDDCFDQIHGYPTTPRTPEITRPAFRRVLSNPIAVFRERLPSLSAPHSPLSSVSTSATSECSPIDILPPSTRRKRNSLRHKPSASSLNTQSSSNSGPSRQVNRSALRTSRLPLTEDLERSYGELDAYPLRRSSVLCKATGGGRWEPKQEPVYDFYRVPVPGGKAPFEIQMEAEENIEKIRRANPVIKHGEFQYRTPREPEPVNISSSLTRLSTF